MTNTKYTARAGSKSTQHRNSLSTLLQYGSTACNWNSILLGQQITLSNLGNPWSPSGAMISRSLVFSGNLHLSLCIALAHKSAKRLCWLRQATMLTGDISVMCKRRCQMFEDTMEGGWGAAEILIYVCICWLICICLLDIAILALVCCRVMFVIWHLGVMEW